MPKPFAAIVPRLDSDPPPKQLMLGNGDEIQPYLEAAERDFATTVKYVRSQDPADAAKADILWLKFGGTPGGYDWDTLCLVTEDYCRQALKRHAEFTQCRSQELKQENLKSVEIVEIPGKGLGLRALRDIAVGERILAERPLLISPRVTSIPLRVNMDTVVKDGMTKEHREAYLKLFHAKPVGPGRNLSTEILATNGSDIEWPYDKDTHGAVYELLSRVNHSCAPNAVSEWNFSKFMVEVFSLVPIGKGDEITINYIDALAPTEKRRAELRRIYAFDCRCNVCALEPKQRKESDARRVALAKHEALMRGESDKPRSQIEFDDAQIEKILGMYEAEGLIMQRDQALRRFAAHEQEVSGVGSPRSVQLAKRARRALKDIGLVDYLSEMRRIIAGKPWKDEKDEKTDFIRIMAMLSAAKLVPQDEVSPASGCYYCLFPEKHA